MSKRIEAPWSAGTVDALNAWQTSGPPGAVVGTPIEGGWRIKTSDDGRHHIDVLHMMYNYRIATTPVAMPAVIDRFWCYAGRTEADLLRARCWLFWRGGDGGDDTEPIGWNKNGQTQEWRDPNAQ